MKTFYPSNDKHNKAAIILSTMAPDMVEDIIDLILTKGRTVLSVVDAEDDGFPAPMAMFSRVYIPDADFPYVYLGWLTCQIADLKKLKGANDYYEQVLQDAFGIDDVMAAALAKKIETRDLIGGANSKWYQSFGTKVGQLFKDAGNWVTSVLNIPWEIDQTQKYDIDYLFELANLGKAVDELASRARLMTSQAMIAKGLGLFNADSGSLYTTTTTSTAKGDIEGLDFGDPSNNAAYDVANAIKPLVGFPALPPTLYRGFWPVAQLGTTVSTVRVHQQMKDAGLTSNKDGKTTFDTAKTDKPHHAALLSKLSAMDPRTLALVAGLATFTPITAAAVVKSIRNRKRSQALGDVTDAVRDAYGDVVADAYDAGDISGVIAGIHDLAAESHTTGDPEIDEQIIGDVLDDLGDVSEDDEEVGGVLRRARINHRIKKANRITRRTGKRNARITLKNRKASAVTRSKDVLGRAEQAAPEYYPDDSANDFSSAYDEQSYDTYQPPMDEFSNNDAVGQDDTSAIDFPEDN